jgi:site-specific recombinase XerD
LPIWAACKPGAPTEATCAPSWSSPASISTTSSAPSHAPPILAWRAELEQQNLAAAIIRRELAALASLYDYLCEANAVTHNPVHSVNRPTAETGEGITPALGDARALLDALPTNTLKGKR